MLPRDLYFHASQWQNEFISWGRHTSSNDHLGILCQMTNVLGPRWVSPMAIFPGMPTTISGFYRIRNTMTAQIVNLPRTASDSGSWSIFTFISTILPTAFDQLIILFNVSDRSLAFCSVFAFGRFGRFQANLRDQGVGWPCWPGNCFSSFFFRPGNCIILYLHIWEVGKGFASEATWGICAPRVSKLYRARSRLYRS